MKLQRLLLLFLSTGILLTSCEDDDSATPWQDREDFHWSETKATINGSLWGDCIPSMFTGNNLSKSTIQDFGTTTFTLSASDICSDHVISDTTVTDIFIMINEPLEEGKTYTLGSINTASVNGWMGNYQHFNANTSESKTGTLSVLKLENNKVSGTFEYSAVLDSIDVMMVVKNGQFEDVPIYSF